MIKMKKSYLSCLTVAVLLSGCSTSSYDTVILNGEVYDGSGNAPIRADIGIRNDKIEKIGELGRHKAATVIDAKGLAVSPGFINMLSWGANPLLKDGRGLSDVKQGVTLELFGEGSSLGPLNEKTRVERWGSDPSKHEWVTLGDALSHMESKGVAVNIGSFVGAATLRAHEVGYDDRAPTSEELGRMKDLMRTEMEQGAMGLGTALIYAPGTYAKTDELIELSKVVGEYGGMYISHMRSEGGRIEDSVKELITIGKEANVHAEIHHLKFAGPENWQKIDTVIGLVEDARKAGQPVSANMYNYEAASTSLAAMFPPWVQDGGFDRWIERLKDPATRRKIAEEMANPAGDWENFYLMSGRGKGIILVGLRNEELQKYGGKSLADVAKDMGKSEIDTAIDLMIAENRRISAIYYLMSEENVKRQIKLPWISFGSDGGALAAEGDVLKDLTHPRAYGNFARLLGKYVRDEGLIPLEAAVHRMTGLPASNLKLKDRGLLKEGYFADVVVFDPSKVQDHATFANPHQYSTGVSHVFVNGTQVLKDGEHTGKMPGKFVRGPGYGRQGEALSK